MARAPSRRLLPPLLLLLLALRAAAHRPLLTGPVGGKVYDTWQTALLVPWVTSSWSVKRVVEVRLSLGRRGARALYFGFKRFSRKILVWRLRCWLISGSRCGATPAAARAPLGPVCARPRRFQALRIPPGGALTAGANFPLCPSQCDAPIFWLKFQAGEGPRRARKHGHAQTRPRRGRNSGTRRTLRCAPDVPEQARRSGTIPPLPAAERANQGAHITAALRATPDADPPVPFVVCANCPTPCKKPTSPTERANQDVHITAVVPAAPGLAALRVGMALFGPGLPKYNASQLACEPRG